MCTFLFVSGLECFSISLMLLLKVTTAKLKKFEKEYSAMKEEQEDPLERLQVLSTSSIASHNIL